MVNSLSKYARVITIAATCTFCLEACAAEQDRTKSAHDIDTIVQGIENGLRPAIIQSGQNMPRWSLAQRMDHYHVPSVSIALIRDGKLAWANAYGVADMRTGRKADTETVYSVGSVSKIGAATISLKMVSDGIFDLDTPVNSYLKTWQIPEDSFTRVRPISLRHILSHTSGLSVHGFPDFIPGEDVPSITDTLDGLPPSKTAAVRPLFVPGTSAKYSGGGITVEQLMISDVTGQIFEEAAREKLTHPLGMNRSTYQNPLPKEFGNIAAAHDKNGEVGALPRGWHTFAEKAASGLWTTPTDIARMLCALIKSYKGEEGAFLPQELAVNMMTEVGPSYFGLGPQLDGSGAQRRFFHSGSNEDYKAWFEGHLETGDGMVIFTNGANGALLYYEIRRAIADAMGWPMYRETVASKISSSAKVLDELAGRYAVADVLPTYSHRLRAMRRIDNLEIHQNTAGKMQVTLPDYTGDDPYELTEISPLKFVVENLYIGTPSQFHIEFIRDANGIVSELALTRGPYTVSAQKVSDKGKNH